MSLCCISDVDLVSGLEFEEFAVQLLCKRGFVATRVGATGDLGVDIVAEKAGIRYAVQCKRLTSSVSRAAVSDCVAGMRVHNCSRSMVITNSHFQPGAIELAAANDCILIGRVTLADWMERPIDLDPGLESDTITVEAGVEVRIVSVTIGRPLIAYAHGGSCNAPDTLITVRIEVHNPSADARLRFEAWSRRIVGRGGAGLPALEDNFGNSYSVKDYGAMFSAVGSFQGESVYPGMTAYDVVTFEEPGSISELVPAAPAIE